MSDSATFELTTTVDKSTIAHRVAELWKGFAYSSDIYTFPGYNEKIFCTLDYVFGYPVEKEMIRKVLNYLLDIASNHEVYYYRCADFIHIHNQDTQPIQISVDDLFREEYTPSIGASIEKKYVIRRV